MRILHVIHQFPPYSSQGSEVYCRTLAEHQATRWDTGVFHVSAKRNAYVKCLTKARMNGLSVWHCIDLGQYQRLADGISPFLQKSFFGVLAELKPTIVHFHNYISLGDGLVSLAAGAGARVVYTLHDFGLICPNNLLLNNERMLCQKATQDFFGSCCPENLRLLPRGRLSVLGRLPALSRWRRLTEQHHSTWVRKVAVAVISLAERVLNVNSASCLEKKREFFQTSTARIFRDVDLFMAPSEFLRDRFIQCGLSPAKIRTLPYGINLFHLQTREPQSRKLRIGYIGAFQAHKGVEVLLSAFNGLQEHAELHIHGSTFGYPVAEAYWKRVSERSSSGVFLHGAYGNEELPQILSRLDVVVVPSIWYENAPLTIQEALHAGIPVVTSNAGGMAEMITHEVNGLTFAIGEPESLRHALLRIIQEPGLLKRLAAGIRPVPSIEEQSRAVMSAYVELCERSRNGKADAE